MAYFDLDGGGGFTPGDLVGGGVLNGDFPGCCGVGRGVGVGDGVFVTNLHLLA